MAIDPNKVAAAVAAPSQRGRTRVNREKLPQQSAQQSSVAVAEDAPATAAAAPKIHDASVAEAALTTATDTSPTAPTPDASVEDPAPPVDARPAPGPEPKSAAAQPSSQKSQTKSAPSQSAPAPSPARARLALRTAEQTFLPLISRIAKLRQYVDESGLAIQDAKAVGVTAEQLEDTLRGIARKTDVRYGDIPETVRATIAAPAEAGAAVPAPRARLALRTVEQTFLPLVSRFAKLRAYVDEAVLAVADAKAAGVDGEHLEDTLRSIARKNGTSYNDIPAAVRAAISDD